ncbi:cytochrome c oxidase subunit 8A, mitochondrial-like [Enhydra lutris kenyoni]|uniref:Cytochrome c oxidase subunit 8A, mitochondrial-like n=1 Tax=Enhydra lutris kenyoni TaxID=391180 RepID=A0A2Y9JZR9_ENHLU|nr:cytochrome c oxidase subunit 8A, mitochondrial-like [Enhydra lutris kenyoni]
MSLPAVQLLRGLTGLTRRLPVQHAQMHSKPPREELGTMDVAVGLTATSCVASCHGVGSCRIWRATRSGSEGGCPVPHPVT